MSSNGPAASTSDWFIRPRVGETRSTAFVVRASVSSRIGRYAMATAEHREPCDSRGSCTVLGVAGGETPPADSTGTAPKQWEFRPSRLVDVSRIAADIQDNWVRCSNLDQVAGRILLRRKHTASDHPSLDICGIGTDHQFAGPRRFRPKSEGLRT
jgi:hypothetical protein